MECASKILAFDTSGQGVSLALLDGREIVARGRREGRPAEGILSAIEEILAEAGWSLASLGLVVVGIGPGSFTGTRVGLATAKGLAFATGADVVGVSSLVARARSVGEGAFAVVTSAGRGEVYAGAYRCSSEAPADELVAPFLASPEHALDRLGGAWPIFAEAGLGLSVASVPPLDPGALGIEGWLRYRAHGSDDAARLEPSYVRPSDAKLPAKPLRIHEAQSPSSSSKREA